MNNQRNYRPPMDWSLIEASAPGRFVLIGDYGNLQERTAIAVAIDRRLKVTIRPCQKGIIRLNLKNFDEVREWPTTLPLFSMTKLVATYASTLSYSDSVQRCLRPLLNQKYCKTIKTNLSTCDKLNGEEDPADSTVLAFFILYLALGDSFACSYRPALDVEIESNIVMRRGLGSSTALGVALCGALMKVFGVSAEPSIIIDWSLNIDKFFHNQVTTLHSSVAVNGGYIYYEKERIKYYGVRHASPLKVILIDTDYWRESKEMIELAEKRLSSKVEFISLALSQLNDLATRIWRLMNDQQFRAGSINQQLEDAQSILDSLGLNHSRMQTIQSIAQRSGFVVKQSQVGETMFLLYDELDERIDEFISDLSLCASFKVDYNEISFDGLSIVVSTTVKKGGE